MYLYIFLNKVMLIKLKLKIFNQYYYAHYIIIGINTKITNLL